VLLGRDDEAWKANISALDEMAFVSPSERVERPKRRVPTPWGYRGMLEQGVGRGLEAGWKGVGRCWKWALEGGWKASNFTSLGGENNPRTLMRGRSEQLIFDGALGEGPFHGGAQDLCR
jgi:hypothetical protein